MLCENYLPFYVTRTTHTL